MFVSRMNRELKIGQLVAVHFNSHKKTFSIVEMRSRSTLGVVLGYSNSITLNNCWVKIDKSKQNNVKNTGVKDRHAYIIGYVKNFASIEFEKQIYYDPKKLDSFVDRDLYLKGCTCYLKNMKVVNLKLIDSKPIVTYDHS